MSIFQKFVVWNFLSFLNGFSAPRLLEFSTMGKILPIRGVEWRENFRFTIDSGTTAETF